MCTHKLLILTFLSIATGCSQSQPAAVTNETARTVTVSAEDPVIRLDDESVIPVDGLPDGESIQLQITETTFGNGQVVVDFDNTTKAP